MLKRYKEGNKKGLREKIVMYRPQREKNSISLLTSLNTDDNITVLTLLIHYIQGETKPNGGNK